MPVNGLRIRSVLTIIAALLVSAPLGWAGQLTPDLEARLTARSSGEKIRVWIRLPKAAETTRLAENLEAGDMTREERHRSMLGRLKQVHEERQRPVLGFLNGLQARGQATTVRARWLANLIEADVSVGQLRQLAARDDIELVMSVPTLTLIEPVTPAQTPMEPGLLQSNLTFIKANQAWAAGYTGAGRIVCTFDTGVDGDHPALSGSWKGNDGNYAAAWFDPAYNEPFPHAIGGNSHGTHVTGTIVGHDDATGDTTGVAPGAQWISAAVLDIAGTAKLDAFEWAADPDGDPNTVADVPDVINHSWGVKNASCIDVFYDFIDNLEALGIVNIFAAGNEGAQVNAIRNPADRALDSIDCFAVGNVNHTLVPPTISGSSSRGPSPCNGATKPNVCAPGEGIRSTVLNNLYGYNSGTSMAAPHVSGLVALLRQKNPNATVRQIKQAILTSAPDFGYALPNNTYGWGMIDCMAALNALAAPAATPNLRVWSFDHPAISPGDTITAQVVVQNRGAASVNNVTGTITGTNPGLIVLDGAASFGTIAANATKTSTDVVSVIVRDTVSTGRLLSLDFQLAGTGYTTTARLYFLVEPRSERLHANHTVNQVRWTVSNYGTYGLGSGMLFPLGGLGWQTLPSTANEIWESAFLLGRGTTQVSDGARCVAGEPDGDFRVAPDGNIVLSTPGAVAAQETHSVFDDSRAENPIGLEVVQQTYAFTEPANDDFIIIRYIITNRNGTAISGLRAGLYFDWDVVSYGVNAGGWDSGDSVLWTAYNSAGILSKYRGMKVLEGPVVSAFTADASETNYYTGGLDNGWTEAEKWAALLSGFTTADTFKTSSIDLMQVIAAGPISLAAGQSDTVAFAVVAGQTLGDLTTNADAASAIYRQAIGGCCIGIRGNVNGDSEEKLSIVDVTYLVSYLFKSGPAPVCPEEGNVTGDAAGSTNLLDLTYLIANLFKAGPDPVSCSVTTK